MKKIILLFVLLLTVVCSALAFDYSQILNGEFAQNSVTGVRTMPDGDHYTTLEGGRVCKYAYKDGLQKGVLFDAAEHEAVGSVSDYSLSGDGSRLLIVANRKPIYRRSYTAKHWVWNIASGELRPLSADGSEEVASFSPDGRRAAFVRDNNIYMVELSDMSLHVVTSDGRENHIRNGHTDWVYEEEFGFTRAYAFSPDGLQIAYIRFDESPVPQFTMMRRFVGTEYPEPYVFRYPRAGEANAKVEVRLFNTASGATTVVDCGADKEYFPRIGWTPSGKLYIYALNRLQNKFDLLLAEGDTTKVIYAESDERYVERLTDRSVTFLSDGDRFVVNSERSGFKHLYLWSVSRGEIGAVTSGDWDVDELLEVSGKQVYYLSCERSPLGRELFRVGLDGRGKRLMTSGDGDNTIAPSAGFKYYIRYFSDAQTPLTVTLHRENGELLRTLEDNAKLKARIAQGDVPRKEFLTFTTERGDVLNGYVLKPVDFDPQRRYPVLMTQYSGPGSQQVLNRWSVDWCDVLTQQGYVVFCVDGRGTGGRGAEFRKCTYGQLGKLEVEDQLSAARWIGSQPWADSSRIGIYGWSYGGFMALNCMLRGNDLFKMGIAVAPVSSWRFYDTIYTEVYNGLPQDNVAGYDDNSPINYAHLLRGKLLIVHGTGDDNVHVQNSYAMIGALVRAGKQFDTAIYADDNHSMRPIGGHHVRERMVEYVLTNL